VTETPAEPQALSAEEVVEKALLHTFQLSNKDYRKMQAALSEVAFIRALEQDGYTVAPLRAASRESVGAGLDCPQCGSIANHAQPDPEPDLREALEACLTELRRRERATGKVISSPVAVFARAALDGLRATPEIEAAVRSHLAASHQGETPDD